MRNFNLTMEACESYQELMPKFLEALLAHDFDRCQQLLFAGSPERAAWMVLKGMASPSEDLQKAWAGLAKVLHVAGKITPEMVEKDNQDRLNDRRQKNTKLLNKEPIAPDIRSCHALLFLNKETGVYEIQRHDGLATVSYTDDDAICAVIKEAMSGDVHAAKALYLDGKKENADNDYWPCQYAIKPKM